MAKGKAKIKDEQEATPQQVVEKEATPPETPAESTVETVAAETLGNEIAEQAPVADPALMEVYRKDEAAKPPVGAAPQPLPPSSPGAPFDGAKKRGRPRKPDGELKEPRRVKGVDATAPLNGPSAGPDINAGTAKVFTGLKEGVFVAIIGEEWKLTDEEKLLENVSLKQALDYYAPAGMPVNPLVMYAAVSFQHAAVRFQKPITQSWWARTKGKLAAKYAMLRYGKVTKHAAHPDSGPNPERENDASNSTGDSGASKPSSNHFG